MKTLKTIFMSIIAIACGLSAPASATCNTTHGCGTPPPASQPTSASVVGDAFSGGQFNAGFIGLKGYAMGEKTGYAYTDVLVSGSSNGCDVNCASMQLKGVAGSGEAVQSAAGAWNDKSGGNASAGNFNSVTAGVRLMFGK